MSFDGCIEKKLKHNILVHLHVMMLLFMEKYISCHLMVGLKKKLKHYILVHLHEMIHLFMEKYISCRLNTKTHQTIIEEDQTIIKIPSY